MSMTQLCLKIADSILIKHFIFSLGKRSNTVAYFSNGFFSQPPTSYLFILGNFSLPNPPVGHPKRAVSLVRESLPETTENTVLRPGALDQTSMASGQWTDSLVCVMDRSWTLTQKSWSRRNFAWGPISVVLWQNPNLFASCSWPHRQVESMELVLRKPREEGTLKLNACVPMRVQASPCW